VGAQHDTVHHIRESLSFRHYFFSGKVSNSSSNLPVFMSSFDSKRIIDSSGDISPERIIDLLPLVAYATDPAGRVTHVNRHWLEYTGYSDEQSLGMAGTDAIHPDDLPAVLSAWGQAVNDLEPYQLEYRLLRSDGVYRWHLGRAGPVFGSSGVACWIGTATDIDDATERITERATTAVALSRSEERLRIGLQVASFALGEVDYRAGTIRLSAEAAGLYGLSEDEITVSRERMHDTFHPDDRASLEAQIVQALDPSGSGWIACEHRVVLPDGQERWLNVRKQIFFDRSSQPARASHAILVAQDISDRKRHEANLAFLAETQRAFAEAEGTANIVRIAGERLVAYLEVAHVLFVEVDDSTGEVSVFHDENDNLNQPSLVGRYRLADFHPLLERNALASGVAVVINDVWDSGRSPAASQGFEDLGIRALAVAPYLRAGRWRFALCVQDTQPRAWREDEVALLKDLAGQVYLRLERLRADEALRDREARYRTFFDSVDQGFCVCELMLDTDGSPMDYRFLEANALFEAQTGLRDAVGRTALELVPNLERHWVELYGRVVLTGEPARFEQGSEAMGRWFDVYASRVGGAGSLRFAVIFKDITERKQLEVRLREVNEAQKRFVSDAAHELRAPLTGILGNLELLRRYTDLPQAERDEMLGEAVREAARLGRLITDMLSLARGTADTTAPQDQVDFSSVLGEAVRAARHFAGDHTLTSNLEPCAVLGDADRLKELSLILLENAAKYTPSPGRIAVSLRVEGDWVELRITDTGPGIAAADLERVFERFYRADPARSPGATPGGTGLGLPIARQIVTQHGGEIRLESQLGVGTTAVVQLPVASKRGT
jgi:PAS domain S-box-containing protein